MIRMIKNQSAAQAKAYFTNALEKSDYYLNDQELQGRFDGYLAEKLGIKGAATKEVFFQLVDNINPQTGKPLTPNTKENRVIFHDINFHCPKSVSVIHALANDKHILDAFQASVSDTMKDIEHDSQTRVRKDKVYHDRPTDNLLWAEFIHQTSRPVGGKAPDMHLHAHCVVFNATLDPEEKIIKAGQFRNTKRDMPYYQAMFHKRLADRLVELGYDIRRTDQAFEISGVPQQVIDRFSKRTDEIERIAEEQGITDAKAKDNLGALTRSKKAKGLTMAELKADWKEQIRSLDLSLEADYTPIRYAKGREKNNLTAMDSLDYSVKHSFERASVMSERQLLATAYRHATGNDKASIDKLNTAFASHPDIIQTKDGAQVFCTTREVLAEEQRMVRLAREGIGAVKPLYETAPDIRLEFEQKRAIEHLVTTKDRVTILRGGAGTGKTTLMQEAVPLINKAGKEVIVVAPSVDASRQVLRSEGFDKADTVSRLLIDKDMQDKLYGQVLWVDEAGLLGTQDMAKVLALAKDKNARVILAGDTRQHAAVVRGDALRILNTVGGIQTADVNKIYRQKNKDYKGAVEDISKGRINDAFKTLDRIGSLYEIDREIPFDDLTDKYVDVLKRKKSALIISPTHLGAEKVTKELREKLRASKHLGKKEITIPKLTNLNLTIAEKGDWRSFQEGQVVQFTQNAPGIKRGSQWTIKQSKANEIIIADKYGTEKTLPSHLSDRYDVLRKSEIDLAKGDKIRITREGYDQEKKRLNNGAMLEVLSVSKEGAIELCNPVSRVTYHIGHDFGHLTHGYCLTSHASQGKTVDEVFIAQPASTFPATDLKQFYVSVSRGRDKAHIYTDDKEALLAHASDMRDRQSAMELVKYGKHLDYAMQRERGRDQVPWIDHNKDNKYFNLDFDYEPGV